MAGHPGPACWPARVQACSGHLDPQNSAVRQFYVYILASRPGGALYVGVTNNLVRRVYEHKNMVEGHTKHHKIDRLVYFEIYDTAYHAIQREKNIKALAARLENTTYCKGQRNVARSV